MSTPFTDQQHTGTTSRCASSDVTINAIGALKWAGRAGSFWLAVVLPFFYLPLLVVGLDTSASLFLFIGFLLLNILALYVGHSNKQDTENNHQQSK